MVNEEKEEEGEAREEVIAEDVVSAGSTARFIQVGRLQLPAILSAASVSLEFSKISP